MSEWETQQLGDLSEVLDSHRVPVREEDRPSGLVPYYGANGQQGWIDRPLFNEPLILLAEDGGHFDDYVDRPIAYRIDGPSWVNNHAHVLRAAPGVDQSYLFWSLRNKDIRRWIAGGTRSKLTRGAMEQVVVPVPPLEEQRRIAEVLDTIDETIHATERVIANRRSLQAGLAADLLKPPNVVASSEKSNETMPPPSSTSASRNWNVGSGRLRDLVDHITTKSVGRKPAGSVYVGLEHIESGTRNLTGTAPSSISNSTNGVFRRGDILFGKLRPNLRKAVQVDFGGYCSTDLLVLRPRTGVDNRYAGYVASSEPVFRHAERNSIGTRMPRTSWFAVSQSPVWVPPLGEQQRIAEILDIVDGTIQQNEAELVKLRELRAGLATDLLSGRVRTVAA